MAKKKVKAKTKPRAIRSKSTKRKVKKSTSRPQLLRRVLAQVEKISRFIFD